MLPDLLNIFTFLLLITAIILQYISIHRLKKRNNALRKSHIEVCLKLDSSEKKRVKLLDQIRQLEWQLAHPPKFKKGDRIGDFIITSYAYHSPTFSEIIAQGATTLFLGLLFGRTESGRDALTKNFESKIAAHYRYEITHTINGNKETKTESELEAFSADQKQ